MSAVLDAGPAIGQRRAIGLETIGMTKQFGASRRSTTCRSRSVPARSTRFWARTAPASRRWSSASWASTSRPAARCWSTARAAIRSPRDAHAHGIGMVYQHFTLVPSLTAAENLVISPAMRRR
jgi:hypothetical protein